MELTQMQATAIGKDVYEVKRLLRERGVQVWVGKACEGGWGIRWAVLMDDNKVYEWN